MAQNTEREICGLVTIKYGPYSGYSEPVKRKLLRSLFIAQVAARHAARALMLLHARQSLGRTNLTGEGVGETMYDVLHHHFGLPAPARSWQADVTTIAQNLLRIYVGLTTPLSIADAHQTIFGLTRKNELACFEADLEIKVLLDPTLSEKEVSELRDAAKQGATRAGLEKSFQTSGLVPKKKKFTDASYDGPNRAKRLRAQDQGSIHINFPTLLDQSGVPEASVAKTIIHEASHKFCDTRDFAYADQPAYRQLGADAIRNADSYGYGALSLAYNRLFRTATDIKAGHKLDAHALLPPS